MSCEPDPSSGWCLSISDYKCRFGKGLKHFSTDIQVLYIGVK